jgi:hypothetical protein
MIKTNYYIDFEFLEGTQENFLGFRTKPTIDMISVGVVAEDGREFYAISKEFNLREAWHRYDVKTEDGVRVRVHWIRDNVLKPIFNDLVLLAKNDKEFTSGRSLSFNYYDLKKLVNRYGLSRNSMKKELTRFLLDPYNTVWNSWDGSEVSYFENLPKESNIEIEIYGYYSAFDHVCLSWIYGKMIDLPDGIPMYTRDLKQSIDEYTNRVYKGDISRSEKEVIFKRIGNYPKQENEHNALADARWNMKLHNFLKGLRL